MHLPIFIIISTLLWSASAGPVPRALLSASSDAIIFKTLTPLYIDGVYPRAALATGAAVESDISPYHDDHTSSSAANEGAVATRSFEFEDGHEQPETSTAKAEGYTMTIPVAIPTTAESSSREEEAAPATTSARAAENDGEGGQASVSVSVSVSVSTVVSISVSTLTVAPSTSAAAPTSASLPSSVALTTSAAIPTSAPNAAVGAGGGAASQSTQIATSLASSSSIASSPTGSASNPSSSSPASSLLTSNRALALTANQKYGTLSSTSSCEADSTACVSNGIATCVSGSWNITLTCSLPLRCFAMPRQSLEGYDVACATTDQAASVMGVQAAELGQKIGGSYEGINTVASGTLSNGQPVAATSPPVAGVGDGAAASTPVAGVVTSSAAVPVASSAPAAAPVVSSAPAAGVPAVGQTSAAAAGGAGVVTVTVTVGAGAAAATSPVAGGY